MILLIGYGNIMRCDDAAGIQAVSRIAEKKITGVDTILTQQLHVELLEEAVRYDRIIFVDATTEGEEVSLRKIDKGAARLVSSHHLNPEIFFELARTIYARELNLYLCSIKGENFDIGDVFSNSVRPRIEKAVELIQSLLNKDMSYA